MDFPDEVIWKTISVHIFKIYGLSKFNFSGGDWPLYANEILIIVYSILAVVW